MPALRFWTLPPALFTVLLLPAPAPLQAQREGPLEVKAPPPRPPRADTGHQAEPSPCPPGYIRKPALDDDAERPPRLRRGVPEEYESTRERRQDEEPECVWSEVVVSSEGKVIEQRVFPPGYDRFLEKVSNEVFRFSTTLPDFICDQLTSRFQSKSNPPRWRRRDRISAEVLYVDGKESYRNIRRNGKRLKRGSPQSTGAWSTGEFGTLMQDLFSQTTDAEFEYGMLSEIGGIRARLYGFKVRQTSSHWRVDFEGHVLYPAYQGSVWIDPDRLRVLRIEMQARDVPPDYPMDTIETTVDYGPVRIAGQEYLLVTKAENLSCKRYSKYCTRNEIEFRNYRKFTAESKIMTTDSTITYEGEAGEPLKK